MKIDRIDKVRDCGIFRNFTWPSGVPDFEKFNLFYGWNATGKTILSNIFRAMEKRRKIMEGTAAIQVDGRSIQDAGFESAVMPKVRVFNQNFVRENVFAKEGASHIFVIGEENIEDHKKLDRLNTALKDHKDSLTRKQQAFSRAKEALDRFCISQGGQIRRELSSSGENPYNNYDKSNFRLAADKLAKSEDLTKYTRTEDERRLLQQQKEAQPKDLIATITYVFPDLPKLAREAEKLLRRTVVSTVLLENLRDDPKLADWVGEGLRLHKDKQSSKCLYCTRDVPLDRIADLEAHFNRQYEQLTEEIDAKLKEIASLAELAKDVALPAKAELYDDLTGDFTARKTELNRALSTVKAVLKRLKESLLKKSSAPFKALSFEAELPDVDIGTLEKFNDVIKKHNKRSEQLPTTVQKARRALEFATVADSLTRYSELECAERLASSHVASLRETIEQVKGKIGELETRIKKHLKPAKDINEDLCGYLGHSDLSLKVEETGYRICRDDKPANNLSEGERTAIALLHFLKSLEASSFQLQKGIVVLDDPVSSLDANFLFHAFGFIKTRTENAAQLFILTHNFSFFRLVRGWFKRFEETGKRKKENQTQFYMLEWKCAEGQRNAHLRVLDRMLRKYDSEYHYLFSLVCRAANDEEDKLWERCYWAPNVARRLLEAFLSFCYPDMISLEKMINQTSIEESKKSRILNFLHAYSHKAGVPGPEHDPSILQETRSVLVDVLKLIEKINPEHYKRMRSIALAPTDTASSPH